MLDLYYGRWCRLFLLAFFASLLTACGGATNDDGALTTQVVTPGAGTTLVLQLTDSAGAAVTSHVVDLGSASYNAQATMRDISGTVIPNRLVKFSTDANFGSFVNGSIVETASTTGTITTAQMSAVTDAKGVAIVQFVGNKLGASTLFAEALLGTSTTNSIKTPLDYQVKSTTSTAAVNLLFTSANPSRLVISTATTGTKTANVQFQLVNNPGVGISGQAVQLSLDAQSITAGVSFINAATGASTTAPMTVVSDFGGIVKATVSSGALPTGVVVTGTLVANTAVKASSVGLSVSSGRISQKSMSISSTTPSVEGFGDDNAVAELTIAATDRLGNPVPAGTVVNFVTSHGLVGTFESGTTTRIVTSTVTGTATAVVVPKVTDSKGSCTLDASSTCKVQLISAGVRPVNGLVTLLAYADGEETFIDLNGNNSWDAGEPFTDMGLAYLDVNGNGVFDLGVDQKITDSVVGTGTFACVGTNISVENSCDGTWSPFMRARQKFVVTWATSQVNIALAAAGRTATGLFLTIRDLNGNVISTNSSVVADIVSLNSNCRVLGTTLVPGATTVGQYQVFLNGDASCAAAAIRVVVTAPSGKQTIQVFN